MKKLLLLVGLVVFLTPMVVSADERYFRKCDFNFDGKLDLFFDKKPIVCPEEGEMRDLRLVIPYGLDKNLGAPNYIMYDVGMERIEKHCSYLVEEIRFIQKNNSGKYNHSKFYTCASKIFSILETERKQTLSYKIGAIFTYLIDTITAPFRFVWSILVKLNPIDSKEERRLKINQKCLGNASSAQTDLAFKMSYQNCLELKGYYK